MFIFYNNSYICSAYNKNTPMKKILFKNKVLEVYDSIDELPIVRFQKYNKYLLIDSGIGSDVDAIDEHIVKIAKLIKSNDSQKAIQELINMRQNLFMINSEISPKYLAFAALVHKVDKEEVKDLSDDGLKEVLTKINKIEHNKILSFLAGFKKKIQEELETYYPEDFVSAKERELLSLIKRRTLLILDGIAEDKDNSIEVEAIDNKMFSKYNPKSFEGEKSAEIKYDKQFEATCLLISQKMNLDAKAMTVLQFYSALDMIKKQSEAESKTLNKNNRR